MSCVPTSMNAMFGYSTDELKGKPFRHRVMKIQEEGFTVQFLANKLQLSRKSDGIPGVCGLKREFWPLRGPVATFTRRADPFTSRIAGPSLSYDPLDTPGP